MDSSLNGKRTGLESTREALISDLVPLGAGEPERVWFALFHPGQRAPIVHGLATSENIQALRNAVEAFYAAH